MHQGGRNPWEGNLILLVAAGLIFQPVTAVADVTTTRGSKYRLETCFTDPKHLRTRFTYPDRSETFVIEGDTATTTEGDKAPQPAGDKEKAFAFGHNFHAIQSNFAQLISDPHRADGGLTGTLVYGGQATSIVGQDGRTEGFRFDLPETTPIELRFSDWRANGRVPYRLELTHAGVTYDYKFTKIEFRCEI